MAAVLAVGLFAVAGVGYAHENPVDPVSNPQSLDFPDVEMTIPKYAPEYQRSGRLVTNLKLFNKINEGTPASRVKTLLGPPLSRTDDDPGSQWNYHLTLKMPDSQNTYLVCQYTVAFDDQQRVTATVWRRRQCPEAIPDVSQPAPKTVFQLKVLFGLDLWKLSGIHPKGLKQLQEVVHKLKNNPAKHRTIVVKGYAGPLASDAYNKALSQRRAETVRLYLLSHMVGADSIKTASFGESDPVATGCDAMSRAELADCYSADRRVVIVARPGL